MAGSTVKPRIGFLGTGWIGRHRMGGMIDTGAIEVAGICDSSPEMAREAAALAPGAAVVDSYAALLALGLDGVVIASPSALHAAQTIEALEAGAAVFCQKPLGRSEAEVAAVVAAAERADRLLGVDLSYRFTDGMAALRERVRTGALGRPFAVDLVFHNAWGPDKPWFYDRALSGGGCVMDLGVHLVDLALWTLGHPEIVRVDSRLLAGGAPMVGDAVEDYAVATLTTAEGVAIRLACSWRLNAGVQAAIGVDVYGTEGGAGFRNRDGSFYDFEASLFRSVEREPLASEDGAWGVRAAADWARRLAAGERYDPANGELVTLSRVLDRIYAGG